MNTITTTTSLLIGDINSTLEAWRLCKYGLSHLGFLPYHKISSWTLLASHGLPLVLLVAGRPLRTTGEKARVLASPVPALLSVASDFLLCEPLYYKDPILSAFQAVGKRLLIKRTLIPSLGFRHGGKGQHDRAVHRRAF
jgi:hypothetical protein